MKGASICEHKGNGWVEIIVKEFFTNFAYYSNSGLLISNQCYKSILGFVPNLPDNKVLFSSRCSQNATYSRSENGRQFSDSYGAKLKKKVVKFLSVIS